MAPDREWFAHNWQSGDVGRVAVHGAVDVRESPLWLKADSRWRAAGNTGSVPDVEFGYVLFDVWYDDNKAGIGTATERWFAPVPPPPPPVRPGLDIPEAELTGGFLYIKPFFHPSKVFTVSRDILDNQMIPSLKKHGNTVICSINWHRADEWSDRYMGIENPTHTLDVLDHLNRAGLCPIAVGFPNNYWTEVLGGNLGAFYDIQRRTAQLVANHVKWYLAMWEGAETMGGSFNRERRLMLEAIRSGTAQAGNPSLRIGRHERPMEGVFVKDIQFLGPVVCALQTGFDATLSGIRDFISSDTARIRGFADRTVRPGLYAGGRFGGDDCLVGAFEHSIPDISPRWRPTQTWAQANERGQACLGAGAGFDLSGGQTR
jgi:hypothetical protein